jgi:transposase
MHHLEEKLPQRIVGEKPGAPLDNTICERVLKRAVLHRKNSLFYKTTNGAGVGDFFMSLIQTAELRGDDPCPPRSSRFSRPRTSRR